MLKNKLFLLGLTIFIWSITIVATFALASRIVRHDLVAINQEVLLEGDEVLEIINTYRSDMGKNPFEKSERLCDWAKIRLYEVKIDWSHRGFFANRVCDRCYLGENLARSQETSKGVVVAWINSPLHKENLDEDFKEACIIVENDYAVGEFGTFE